MYSARSWTSARRIKRCQKIQSAIKAATTPAATEVASVHMTMLPSRPDIAPLRRAVSKTALTYPSHSSLWTIWRSTSSSPPSAAEFTASDPTGKRSAQAIRVPLLWTTTDRPTIVVSAPSHRSCLSTYVIAPRGTAEGFKLPCLPK